MSKLEDQLAAFVATQAATNAALLASVTALQSAFTKGASVKSASVKSASAEGTAAKPPKEASPKPVIRDAYHEARDAFRANRTHDAWLVYIAARDAYLPYQPLLTGALRDPDTYEATTAGPELVAAPTRRAKRAKAAPAASTLPIAMQSIRERVDALVEQACMEAPDNPQAWVGVIKIPGAATIAENVRRDALAQLDALDTMVADQATEE